MNKALLILWITVTGSLCATAQRNALPADSIKVNEEITVYAFSQSALLKNTPAAVTVIDQQTLQRFNNNSFVATMNTVPGVKMDERSPGSYRISIRGNLLRSAFGVRNVKVYLDGLPYTDASGNTYFNALAVNSIDKMEIIKGPGGSMYGAGTGGVILLRNEPADSNSHVLLSAGNYGMFAGEGKYRFGKGGTEQDLSFTHQQGDGYRHHSKMRRDVAGYTLSQKVGSRSTIRANILYSNLSYETPGGLTLSQINADSRQARPASSILPGSEQQKAGIYLSTFYGSILAKTNLNKSWSTSTGVYFSQTSLRNPAIRNFEQKQESGAGGRTVFSFTQPGFDLLFGGEYQYSFINTSVYNNKGGEKAALQFHDKIPVHQGNIFVQASVKLPLRSKLTGGISFNDFFYGFHRVSLPALIDQSNFTPQYIPRLSLLKGIGKAGSIYVIFSKGYSPPTIDEIHAGNGIFNKALEAEKGINYEAGIRLPLLKDKLFAEINYYIFHLDHTIVRRIDAGGGDYFLNAGRTNQRGLEYSFSWLPLNNVPSFIRHLHLQATGNYLHARFQQYKQGNADYSGNRLTGSPPFVFSLLADIRSRAGVYSHINYSYTDRIPLNDANSFFAGAYRLFAIKLGWVKKLPHSMALDIFSSIQKSFNKPYSLGNDLNAEGNRFFNPSAPQTLVVGMGLRF